MHERAKKTTNNFRAQNDKGIVCGLDGTNDFQEKKNGKPKNQMM